jgi:hypothetical protein
MFACRNGKVVVKGRTLALNQAMSMAQYDDRFFDWTSEVRRVVAAFRPVVLPNGRCQLIAEYDSLKELVAAEAVLFTFMCMFGENDLARGEDSGQRRRPD